MDSKKVVVDSNLERLKCQGRVFLDLTRGTRLEVEAALWNFEIEHAFVYWLRPSNNP